jgi:hypothetical protein
MKPWVSVVAVVAAITVKPRITEKTAIAVVAPIAVVPRRVKTGGVPGAVNGRIAGRWTGHCRRTPGRARGRTRALAARRARVRPRTLTRGKVRGPEQRGNDSRQDDEPNVPCHVGLRKKCTAMGQWRCQPMRLRKLRERTRARQIRPHATTALYSREDKRGRISLGTGIRDRGSGIGDQGAGLNSGSCPIQRLRAQGFS